MELIEYILIIRRRIWLIIALFLCAVISAAVASLMMTPVYQAITSIMIESESKAAQLPFDVGLGADLGNKNEIQNQVEILKSRTIAELVAIRLGFDPNTDIAKFKEMRNSITIQPVQGTDSIKINVQSTDRGWAQKVANTLVDVFIERSQLDNQEDVRSARLFIEDQLSSQRGKLKRAEDQLELYKKEQKVVAPADEVKAQLDKLTALETQASATQVELEASQVKLAQIRKQVKAEDRTLVSSRTISGNPLVQEYKSKLAELEVSLAGASEKYTDKHPTVIGIKAEIEDLKDKLAKEVSRIVSNETSTINPVYQALLGKLGETEVEVVSLQTRLQALKQVISQGEVRLADLPQKELDYARLQRDKSVAEEIYLMLLKRYEEVKISEAQKTAMVRRIDIAQLPMDPIKPKKKLNVAIAGFLGLFIGCGLAFLIEYMDTSIKTPDDVEKYLGVPLMGTIPIIKEDNSKAKKTMERKHRRTVKTNETIGGEKIG